ncbi:hypothetical protein LXL04_007944 [Taraxacum kok-saghyz]
MKLLDNNMGNKDRILGKLRLSSFGSSLNWTKSGPSPTSNSPTKRTNQRPSPTSKAKSESATFQSGPSLTQNHRLRTESDIKRTLSNAQTPDRIRGPSPSPCHRIHRCSPVTSVVTTSTLPATTDTNHLRNLFNKLAHTSCCLLFLLKLSVTTDTTAEFCEVGSSMLTWKNKTIV